MRAPARTCTVPTGTDDRTMTTYVKTSHVDKKCLAKWSGIGIYAPDIEGNEAAG